MSFLELFKGTGSVGKVAKRFGYDNIISLDFLEKYKPTIHIDILKWNYKKYYKDTGFTPDFIWASPPCNTYSSLVHRLHERDTRTAEPISDRAKEGTAILYKTLQIIKYFLKINPKMKYCIENPRGMMRKDPKMKRLQMETTHYCLYGDIKNKPTDFWSNYPLNLDQRKSCPRATIGVQYMPNLDDRYSIPPKLIKKILLESMNE